MTSLDAKLSLELTEGLKKEIVALRLALQEKDESFKAYIAEEVKRQVDSRFEAYSRLFGMQVPTSLNLHYK
jgi:hypothetical protein